MKTLFGSYKDLVPMKDIYPLDNSTKLETPIKKVSDDEAYERLKHSKLSNRFTKYDISPKMW